MFCRYSPLLYRFKTLSSWAAVSSIPQWSSPLKAEEKNYLDEEHSAQDKTKFHLNEALSMGALWCPAPGMWCGQEIPELLQVRFHTWHNPGIPAQNPKSAGTKHWGEPPTRDQHQPIQGIPKLCLIISYSPPSFIFPFDAHWSKELQNLQIRVTGNYSSQSHCLGNQRRSMERSFEPLASEV